MSGTFNYTFIPLDPSVPLSARTASLEGGLETDHLVSSCDALTLGEYVAYWSFPYQH